MRMVPIGPTIDLRAQIASVRAWVRRQDRREHCSGEIHIQWLNHQKQLDMTPQPMVRGQRMAR